MKFRAKAPARLLEELSTLAGRHRLTFFEATDNIADHRWVAGLFDGIAKSRSDYEFFYEIKSNVTQDQIRALHRGGVRWVQPGIESLSTHVLALMRKGCTMLQNLLALKWCRYYRIRVSWNLIWGFPGEEEVDYRRELEVLRLISHLEPPGGCGRIWLERFAPYFTQTDVFPIRSIRPERSYAHAYPPHVNLDRIAYFFDYDMDSTVPEPVHDDTRAWVDEWRARWKSESPDSLVYRRTRDHVFIDDRRGPDFAGSHSFSGPLATAYEYASDQIRSAGQIAAHVNAAHGLTLTRAEIEEAMGLFCSRGLAVVENGRYLALALPANPNW
jgi:ribosomal peptide maturation radical SAM protein 1